LIFLFGLVLLS